MRPRTRTAAILVSAAVLAGPIGVGVASAQVGAGEPEAAGPDVRQGSGGAGTGSEGRPGTTGESDAATTGTPGGATGSQPRRGALGPTGASGASYGGGTGGATGGGSSGTAAHGASDGGGTALGTGHGGVEARPREDLPAPDRSGDGAVGGDVVDPALRPGASPGQGLVEHGIGR
jgi:hypothetical protein